MGNLRDLVNTNSQMADKTRDNTPSDQETEGEIVRCFITTNIAKGKLNRERQCKDEPKERNENRYDAFLTPFAKALSQFDAVASLPQPVAATAWEYTGS
ncbi:hypothetical protein ACLMJK_000838 [Lecanora helva]